jgi:holo-[acyl-carrier protein] synthase
MIVLGICTEITECPRIGKMIEQHGELFLRRVFTDREIRCCQAKKRALEHFAARWAAKEAIFKAIGTGPSRGIGWTDIEVRSQSGGRLTAHLRGGARDWTSRRGIRDVLITISHCRTYATAYALALGRPVARGEQELVEED